MKVNGEFKGEIAGRKQVEDALHASEFRYRNLFENSPVSLWEEDASEVKAYIDTLRKSGVSDFREHWEKHPETIRECASLLKILNVNRATLEMYKARDKEYFLDGLSRVFDKESFTVYGEAFIAFIEGKALFEADTVIHTFDGAKRHVSIRISLAPDCEKTWERVFVSLTDITAQKQTEEALRHKVNFEKTMAGISARFALLSDFDNAVSTSLADAGRLVGAGRAYLFQLRDNGDIMDNTHEWCDRGVSAEIQNLQNLPSEAFPWWMAKLRSGSVIHIPDVSGLPPDAAVEKELLERQGIKSLLVLQVYAEKKLVGFIGFDNVITTSAWCEVDIDLLQIMAEIIGVAIARKQTEALIRHMAYHDTLTNLPNRILFHDRLQRAVILTKRAGMLVATMILDLDCFKTINDSLGHCAGDLMLKIVAERLTQCVREGDTIARTGGDEFAIILPDLFDAKDAALVAQKILGTLYQPLHLDGHIIAATASLGISIYPSDTDNTEELIMKADIAMYQAKKLGKNTYRFYNPDMNTHV